MIDDAVRIDRFSVAFGHRTVLDVDAMHIGQGEFLGLLGPNGAGKSTLLRSLLGMQRHANGDIRILGQTVGRLPSGQLARLRRFIGYVPQQIPPCGEMPLTVREVIAIGRTGIVGLLRPLRREDWRIVDEWTDRLGLTALARKGFGEISGGEQRKVLIARAMVQQPELLLLDEPTANLDMGWREEIVRIIHDLHTNMQMTIILVCHELEVLPACCGRIVVLEDGRIIHDGQPEHVLSTELIRSLYGPGLHLTHNAGRWAVIPGEASHA